MQRIWHKDGAKDGRTGGLKIGIILSEGRHWLLRCSASKIPNSLINVQVRKVRTDTQWGRTLVVGYWENHLTYWSLSRYETVYEEVCDQSSPDSYGAPAAPALDSYGTPAADPVQNTGRIRSVNILSITWRFPMTHEWRYTNWSSRDLVYIYLSVLSFNLLFEYLYFFLHIYISF